MEVVWRIVYRAAQLLDSPWRFWRTQDLMAVSLDRTMEVCHVVYFIV
jgi:hypothetical protein